MAMDIHLGASLHGVAFWTVTHYRVSTGRGNMLENRETRSPGSILAFHVSSTTKRIRRSLNNNPSDTLNVGTGNPLPHFLPT